MNMLVQVIAKLFLIITLVTAGLARPQHFGETNQEPDPDLLPLINQLILQDQEARNDRLNLYHLEDSIGMLPSGSNLPAGGNPGMWKRNNNRRLSTLYIDDLEPIVQNNRLNRGTRCFLNPVTCFKK